MFQIGMTFGSIFPTGGQMAFRFVQLVGVTRLIESVNSRHARSAARSIRRSITRNEDMDLCLQKSTVRAIVHDSNDNQRFISRTGLLAYLPKWEDRQTCVITC
jgi:hypothetical protein